MIDNHPMPSAPQPEALQFNPLLITFLLRRTNGAIQARCRGCREIIPLATYRSDYIKGLIELDGRLIPVIDVQRRFHAEETELGPCSCIVIVEQSDESQPIPTGIILGDINDVMQLVAGDFESRTETATNVNLHFVIETCHRSTPDTWLADIHHIALHQQQPGTRPLPVN